MPTVPRSDNVTPFPASARAVPSETDLMMALSIMQGRGHFDDPSEPSPVVPGSGAKVTGSDEVRPARPNLRPPAEGLTQEGKGDDTSPEKILDMVTDVIGSRSAKSANEVLTELGKVLARRGVQEAVEGRSKARDPDPTVDRARKKGLAYYQGDNIGVAGGSR